MPCAASPPHRLFTLFSIRDQVLRAAAGRRDIAALDREQVFACLFGAVNDHLDRLVFYEVSHYGGTCSLAFDDAILADILDAAFADRALFGPAFRLAPRPLPADAYTCIREGPIAFADKKAFRKRWSECFKKSKSAVKSRRQSDLVERASRLGPVPPFPGAEKIYVAVCASYVQGDIAEMGITSYSSLTHDYAVSHFIIPGAAPATWTKCDFADTLEVPLRVARAQLAAALDVADALVVFDGALLRADCAHKSTICLRPLLDAKLSSLALSNTVGLGSADVCDLAFKPFLDVLGIDTSNYHNCASRSRYQMMAFVKLSR